MLPKPHRRGPISDESLPYPVMRLGNLTSLAAMKERLLDFIDYFNRTFAKPFRWTYPGRPTTAETVKRHATWKEIWASNRTNCKTPAAVG